MKRDVRTLVWPTIGAPHQDLASQLVKSACALRRLTTTTIDPIISGS
jgi:hypothetical protein